MDKLSPSQALSGYLKRIWFLHSHLYDPLLPSLLFKSNAYRLQLPKI